MSHDKIRAAARERMARTGESYATARRNVIREHRAAGAPAGLGARWFAISYSRSGLDRVTAWLDGITGSGPGSSGVEVAAGQIRVRMGSYKLDIPRESARRARHSTEKLRGTTGVHMHARGQLLINGSADGLVEVTIDPPVHTARTFSTMFVRERVTSLLLSVDDPDGFIAAVNGRETASRQP